MATTVLHGGEVFTGTGVSTGDLLIDDGRITDVGTDLDGDEGVDCTGKTLLPGFFDCHIHVALDIDDFDLPAGLTRPLSTRILRFPKVARRLLGLGITTIRDAGGADAGFRNAVEDGLVVGPRMQVSIAMLSMTGGHADLRLVSGADPYHGFLEYPGMVDGVCDGVDGCVRKVRDVIRLGADVVKIAASGGFFSPVSDPHMPNFHQEELDAIVRTAADLGRPVMSHTHGAEAIKRAVRAGVRSIDHGTFLDDEGAEMMVEAGTWLVPTLTAGDTTEQMAANPNLPPSVRAKFVDLGRPELDAFRLAVDAGVKIAMGTDTPVSPHGTNLNELRHMAANGLTPAQALQAITANAAELMGLEDDLGSLDPGKLADVVVVNGDAFDFDALEDRIEQVWKAGRRVA